MAVNFIEELKKRREIVWKEIQKYVIGETEDSYPNDIIKNYRDIDKFHWDMIAEYPKRRGKYIRPGLLLLACEAMGGDVRKAIKTAAAMQLSEDWILVHDDVEDGSMERRGRPTFHIMYSPALAINIGDALHMIMWKVLIDNELVLGERKAHAVFDEFYKMLMRAAAGQTAEIKWTEENKINLKYEDIYFLLDGKTTYYTIAGPLRLGAIIAGATKEQLKQIFQLGLPLGRAFQIRDDLLNVVGDRKKYGKEIGGDIIEGKRTVMIIHLLKNANKTDKKKVIKIMNKSREKKTLKDVALVIDMMHKYGSIKFAQKKADEFTEQALAAFKKMKFFKPGKARDTLEAAVRFMAMREA
jgi:geranylgeranyl diphosphate synthase type II